MLPAVLINKILEYKSEMCNNSWIPYLDKNDKIKFKINKYAKRNNIKNVLLHKLNNPPRNMLIELNTINTPNEYDSFIETTELTTTTNFLYYNKNNIKKHFMILQRIDKNQYDYLYYQYEENEVNEESFEFGKINGFYFENHLNNAFDSKFQYNILNNKSRKDPSKEIMYMFPKIVNDDDVIEIGISGHYLQEFIWYNENWISIFEYHDYVGIDSHEYQYYNHDDYQGVYV